MRNDDWSRRQTTWPLSFRRLPHQSLNGQCGKMQTSSAENAIKLSTTPEFVFWPWMQSTVFSKCLLYAVRLIWFANKWTDVYAWQHVCRRKPRRKHKKLYIVTFRPQLQLVCLTAVFLIVVWCHSNEAQGSYSADVIFTGQWITVLYYCENNVFVCVFESYDNLYSP